MKNYRDKITYLLRNNPNELQIHYYFLVKKLSKIHPRVLERTKEERIFEKRLNKSTKLQYFTNFWIGPYNFDFFFPYLNLVIEINGNIHHTENKMKRDFTRVEYLSHLGIKSTVIENWDINSSTVKNLNFNIQNLPRIDYRAKKRLLNKIYSETLYSQNINLIKSRLLNKGGM